MWKASVSGEVTGGGRPEELGVSSKRGRKGFQMKQLPRRQHLLGRVGGFMWQNDGAVVVGIVGKRPHMSLVALLVFIN